ncbi:hypothetical protein [Bacillus ndiopicus]|uniref:hypothetical protein n=1 Tax=Bacillus ndiopicus TaxID=1347368 RepID=UPI0005A655F1|nr:hypothetical protein [Bacillus ndiopicus]
MRTKFIDTAIGVIDARDALVLEKFIMDRYPKEVELSLNLATTLASNISTEEHYIDISIIFKNVVKFGICALDYFDENLLDTCFCEVIDSDFLNQQKTLVEKGFKHYFLECYDEVIEVVAQEYNLILPDAIRLTDEKMNKND